MKTVKVHVSCGVCGFSVEYDLDTNSHDFFELPDAYCPVCLLLIIQEIKKLPNDMEGGG